MPPDDPNPSEGNEETQNSGKQAKKMHDRQIQEITKNKDWHKTNLKSKIIRRYRQELRGSSNFDFYQDPKTKEIFIQGNKSNNRIKINIDDFL